jgi:hypothetical protein
MQFFDNFKTFPYQNRFSSFIFFGLVETLEREKPRKQTLDMTRYKENPRITCNNKN